MDNEIEKFIEELKNRDIAKEDIEKLTEYANQGYIPWINSNKLIEILKKYAEAGNVNAQYLIAIYFSEKEDYQKYLYWLRQSAENGCTKAWYLLAMDSNNNKEAFKWCLKSAIIGNIHAQNLLGNFYYGGTGCKKDIKKALKWYKISAKHNEDLAQESLGYMYEKGKRVKQNYKKAIYWYRKSTKQNNEYAQYNLGYLYEKGRGVKQNYKKALEWYKQSAINDFPDAQYRLGYFYEKGKGTKKNLEKALEWYKQSADEGSKKGQNAFQRLSKNIIPKKGTLQLKK